MRQVVRMRRLREMASTDPLTGVANRRSLEQLGEHAIARAQSSREPLSALAIDVDHFKQVNDRPGPLNEIGRASGRERMCPYGSISVVARYLKKKKTTN